jgi:hypothetical protein
MVDGVTVTPESIVAKLPERFRAMFVPITGRWDVSSTELRARAECA